MVKKFLTIKPLEINMSEDKIGNFYQTLNLHEKKELFETLIFRDVVVFNYEHGTERDAAQVCHVAIDDAYHKIMLTIHRESNIDPSYETRKDGESN
jgi:hypothetical protein